MVIGTVRIQPGWDRRGEVLEILRSIQGPVTAQHGCAGYEIYCEDGGDDAIVLVERWDSPAALRAHLQSEHYRRILAAIELAGGRPEVRFDHVSSSEGLELIERIRNSASRAARG